MSKVRSDNISNRADDGAPKLVFGAEVPVGYGITGAGGINITGIATATSFSGSTGTFSGVVEIGGDANNGTAEGIELNTSGFLQLSRGSGVSALLAGYTQGSSTQTVRINNDGTATFKGDITIADKIIHDGDTNTAIRFPAADTFTVETAGSERLRISSSGSIGVGEADPSPHGGEYRGIDVGYKGSGITGRTGNPTFTMRSNIYYDGSNWKYGEGSTTAGVLSVGGAQLIFENAASGTAGATATLTERLRIDSSGKTGININNPGSYNSAGNELVLGNTGSNGGMTIVSGTGNNGHIFFADGTGTPNQGIIKYEHANDAMAFNTNTGERLRILSGGGITFNGDTATANALDDYEEGTFTPTAANFSVSGTSTLTGQYVKVGRQVTVGIKFANTGTIAYGVSAFITLPFAMASGTEAHGLIGMLDNANGTAFNSNKSGVQCKLDGEGGARFFPGSFTTSSSGANFLFGGTYIAAS